MGRVRRAKRLNGDPLSFDSWEDLERQRGHGHSGTNDAVDEPSDG